MDTRDVQETLARRLRTMFPDSRARDQVATLLARYGSEPSEHEPDRVRLDILKLAGSSIEAVETWVNVAKTDYRDVLAAAEYPSQLRSPTWKLTEEDLSRIALIDRKQYTDWLDRE